MLVIHENRGLTAHIRTIPGRLATDGYTALAIDLLSEEGGTAALPSEGDATAALGNAPLERMIADLRAGLDELEQRAPGAPLVHEMRVFPGVDHAFFNDTSARYDHAQATAAYTALLEWFAEHLAE